MGLTATSAGVATDKVPSYVLEYAPVVWLHSHEEYLPSDLASQLKYTTPRCNGKPVTQCPSPLTLDNLDSLNAFGQKNVFLSSNDDVAKDPVWLRGVRPDASGKTDGAKSCCIIVNDHGSGLLDAFYLYFYAYNQGQKIFGKELGDHVADWEHNMIRFKDGKPALVWYSQHASGEAMEYKVTEKYKNGPRLVSYSAKGTHASYASPGSHDHALPHCNLKVGILEDHCERGIFWDPTLSAYIYKYEPSVRGKDTDSGTFKAYDAGTPLAWLNFLGHWGDDRFPANDPRQKNLSLAGHFKYEGGPTGPYDKVLERVNIWPHGAYGEHIWKLSLPPA